MMSTTSTAAQLAGGLDRFGMRLLQTVVTSDDAPENGNILLSGCSVGLALLMTQWGARGETAAEIAALLGIDPDADWSPAARALSGELVRSEAGLTLHLANALWARSGFGLAPRYVQQCAEAMGANLESLDFSSPAAAKRINGWVEQETRGAIARLVPDQIHPLTVLFITNVLYFLGQWATPFDPALTEDEPFDCHDGQRRAVPMMHRQGEMAYAEDELGQAVRLPFVGGMLALDVILPRQGLDLAQLMADVDAQTLGARLAYAHPRPGSLAMPRLDLANKWHLGATLRTMGMIQAFDASRADFRDITGSVELDGLHVSRVLHNTMLKVDEQGAEAAAATAVEMRLRGLPMPEQPFLMRVNRPYLVKLVDTRAGAALMQGVVGDPSTDEA